MTDAYRPISDDDYKPKVCPTCKGAKTVPGAYGWWGNLYQPCPDCSETGEKKDE